MWSISGLARGQRKPHGGNVQKRSESQRGTEERVGVGGGGVGEELHYDYA